ncbi:nucleotidyltransferase family protein [Paenibacillus xylanexedens]|uniref:Nucleotidyltransferase family protein n=1 Tax=Paenibacillus xylanexedens TaxID=528191 RepID=A0ABS4RSG0_PAEXY|nr:nucleotidyltransferase family protein [Paenibacillus xylanexedens]MBP2245833.1 hypothetical protein [Paenibacillus xylanexedens]
MKEAAIQTFILECINFKNYDNELLKNTIGEISDWDLLLDIINHHRIGGIVYSVLVDSQLLDLADSSFKSKLSMVFENNKTKNDDLTKILKHLGSEIENESYNYAFLKGSYLIPKLYAKGQRISNDIDILISQKDIDKIDVYLKKMNFVQKVYRDKAGWVEPTRKEKIFARMNYGELLPYFRDYGLKGIETAIVDVNISLDFQAKYNLSLVDRMLENTFSYDINGTSLCTLNREDFLIHLCAHLFKEATIYDWVKENRDTHLYKYCDIYAFLLEVEEDFFEKFNNKVLEYGLEKECYFTLINSIKLFPYLAKRKGINILLENIKPNDLNYFNIIYWPLEKKSFSHNCEFISWVFCDDKLKMLREIENVTS